MSEHTNSLLRIRAAQLHARLEEAAQAHQRLVAENAKLRAELGALVAAVKAMEANAITGEAPMWRVIVSIEDYDALTSLTNDNV